ncbi:MAG: MerR family transcriptional regulator [Candidatus Contendobacter sp.]|nr:MerR family transcriptional regulator [Candidatus Contendobacter sp.]
MNITLAVDEKTVEQARKTAQAMGKSLNQAVRDYLMQLAGADRDALWLETFVESARRSPGRLGGWRFDRDQLHERS